MNKQSAAKIWASANRMRSKMESNAYLISGFAANAGKKAGGFLHEVSFLLSGITAEQLKDIDGIRVYDGMTLNSIQVQQNSSTLKRCVRNGFCGIPLNLCESHLLCLD